MAPQECVCALAQRLIRHACRRLPVDVREECQREWTAELPVILDDPEVRFAVRRMLRVLMFAADQRRTVRHLQDKPAQPDVRAHYVAAYRRSGQWISSSRRLP